jgi:hypothetical protein
MRGRDGEEEGGYISLNIGICSSFQEEGDDLISAIDTCKVEKSGAILEREMRRRVTTREWHFGSQ